MFVDREEEIAHLERAAATHGGQLIVLYGRRRVGKTELLREFCRGRRAVFYVADQRPADLQLREFSAHLWAMGGESPAQAPVFPGWAEAFAYAGRLARSEPLVLVLDEFPYVALADPSLPSVLQRAWDTELAKTRLLLILCGSSVSYMEGEVLSERSPLFGRRTGQVHLQPLGLQEAARFWRGWSPEDAIRAYAVVGGVPAYAGRLDASRDLGDNVRRELLNKNAYLYEEVTYLLMQELREPRLYLALLEAVANGRNTQNEIAQAVGIPGNQAAPYLKTLTDLRLVERIVPVQEPHPHKSRRGRYRIRDPFLRFWFRFVLPNRSRLERGLVSDVWKESVAPRLDEHTSLVFEDLAADHVWRRGAAPFAPVRVGRWWTGSDEVEVVAVPADGKEVFVAECKWTRSAVGAGVLDTLTERAERVRASLSAERVHLGLYSRSTLRKNAAALARTRGIRVVRPRELVRG